MATTDEGPETVEEMLAAQRAQVRALAQRLGTQARAAIAQTERPLFEALMSPVHIDLHELFQLCVAAEAIARD